MNKANGKLTKRTTATADCGLLEIDKLSSKLCSQWALPTTKTSKIPQLYTWMHRRFENQTLTHGTINILIEREHTKQAD